MLVKCRQHGLYFYDMTTYVLGGVVKISQDNGYLYLKTMGNGETKLLFNANFNNISVIS